MDLVMREAREQAAKLHTVIFYHFLLFCLGTVTFDRAVDAPVCTHIELKNIYIDLITIKNENWDTLVGNKTPLGVIWQWMFAFSINV